MSEYQYIGFRAVDGPVSKKNLEYMEDQSSRAEITPWSFDNEYEFGDFRGNAVEMLRRGYDIHLHYANFGVRTLLIRLPNGLPAPKAVKPYLERDRLSLLKDKKGPGCILSICPYYESGYLEDIWNAGEIFDSLVGIRAEVIEGDLRPLYLAHLGISTDGEHDPEKTKEAPVPAGLATLTEAQLGMAELYELSDSLLAAAARESAPMPSSLSGRNSGNECATWLRGQPATAKDAWLAKLVSEPDSNVRGEILAEFRASHKLPAWPVSCADRTMTALQTLAEEIERESKRKRKATAGRKRK